MTIAIIQSLLGLCYEVYGDTQDPRIANMINVLRDERLKMEAEVPREIHEGFDMKVYIQRE